VKWFSPLTALMARLTADPGQLHRAEVLKDPTPEIPWLSPGRHLNPNLDTGTDKAGQWQELHDALIDPKAAACLDIRCQMVSCLPWSLQPRPETPQAVTDLVREALEHLNLAEDFEELAKADYFGLVPMEVHWEVRKGRLLPSDLESFDPFFLSFDERRTPLVNGQPMEPGKLILHRYGSQFRNPWGLGRGRTIPRWVRVKAAIAYATYRDYPRYSHDKLKVTYPTGTGDDEQARNIAIAQKLVDAPGLVIPEGMDVEGIKLDSKFETGAKLIEAANGEIALGILGNTLTTGEGKHGTQALGNVHQEQNNRQEVTSARRIEATLNRTLIPWLVALNFGPDVVPPKFAFEHEISAEMKERLDSAMGWRKEGLPVSQSWIRTTFGIPAPIDEEDALKQVAQPEEVVHVNPGPGKAGAAKAPAESDEDDDAQLSADEPVEQMFAFWMQGAMTRQGNVDRLAAQVIREAQSYSEALPSLLALAKDFPTSAGEHLTVALQAARDFGAFEAGSEVKALHLEDEPEMRFDMAPEAALRWLQAKIPMSIKQADALKDGDLRARAFWVAGVEQIGLLQDLQAGMAQGLAKGTPWGEFQATWLPRLEGSGITAKRLRLAYDTHLHSAYMGGRMTSLQDNDLVENLTYVTALDESVRPNHRRVHGVTRPKGDFFWRTHTPPCGYRCRCRIRASEAERAITKDGDSRLTVPPDTGFGEGAPSFASYLNAQAREATTWSPVAEDRQGFEWLASTRPKVPLPALPEPPRVPSGLVADPTGRRIHVPAGVDASPVAAPAEVWLAPVESPEGDLALQIAWIRPDGVLLSVDGVTSSKALTGIDPEPFRRGVRLL
jgi:SPP1 gp7 family putative phage head morphogenesis protein